ncbi:MAG: HEPN domain-containing protein [bacterium]|nr:HEPN domain-containing protein [bacterium]
MKPEDTQALISYRMERSKESIQAAQIMLENEMLTFSMNRVYYAMFYAVQALLVLHGVSFSKHGQVKGYFNRELIKTGVLPIEMGKTYNKAFEYRQKFDYVDFAVPDHEMVCEYIEKAREFHARIHGYIQAQQQNI